MTDQVTHTMDLTATGLAAAGVGPAPAYPQSQTGGCEQNKNRG
jgi:hypothetical protein